MNTSSLTSIVIGLAVLLLLIWRQVQKRSVKEDSRPTLMLILGVVGLIELVTYFKGNTGVGSTAMLMLAASLVLAAGFGAIRAYSVRLWREDGTLWRQGGVLTVVLWLVTIGVHFGADFLIDRSGGAKGLAEAALVLYLAVSLGVQRLVVSSRATHVLA